jgi:phospholipid/cholesterol/gamma-HCH transport system substrate-binding protein
MPVRFLRSPAGVGAVVLALFAGAVVFGLNATHGMPLVARKTVTVEFSDLSGLNTGDDVRIAGMRVGHVDAIDLRHGHAVAVLKLDDPSTRLYQNAVAARVVDRSGLGQKFVDLDPGDPSTGPLLSGPVPASRTVKSEDLSQLLDVFDPQTRAASSEALRDLGGGMLGHGDDLHALARHGAGILQDTATVSRAMAAGDGVPLEQMLSAADRLSSRMAGRSTELAALTEQLGETVQAFGVDDGRQVRDTLAAAPGALDDARAALHDLDGPLADTAVAMRTLRPGASALGASTPDLRAFLREAVTPLDRVPAVSKAAVPGIGALTGFVTDARPLATQLVRTGTEAAPVVSVLGRYAWDIANFYTNASGALSHGDSAGHWLRILLLPGAESVAGTLPAHRDPYPAPSGGTR